MSRNDVVNAVGVGTFTWNTSLPSGWTGSAQQVNHADFTTNIKNNGSCGGASAQLMGYSQMTACAVNSTPSHSPLVSNPTFSGGSLTSWATANASACNGALFVGVNGSDEDGDSGYASATSATCVSTPAQVTLSQTFTISGTPTNQSYSFWYLTPLVQAGDAPDGCTVGTGSASISVKFNATTVSTTTAVTDGLWHQLTGATTALVNGSNTITLTGTLTAASGQNATWNQQTQSFLCNRPVTSAQAVNLDNVVLTAQW